MKMQMEFKKYICFYFDFIYDLTYDFILFNLLICNFPVKIEYESACAYCPNKFFI